MKTVTEKSSNDIDIASENNQERAHRGSIHGKGYGSTQSFESTRPATESDSKDPAKVITTAEMNDPDKHAQQMSAEDVGNATNDLSSKFGGMSLISFIVSVLALLIAGYVWYQGSLQMSSVQDSDHAVRVSTLEKDLKKVTTTLKNEQQKQTEAQDERFQQLDASVDEKTAALEARLIEQQALNRQINASLSQLEQQGTSFRNEFTSLSDSIIQLRSELGRSIHSWNLEEIEQLLIVANQRVRMSSDFGLAISALELADQRLDELADPSLIDMRRMLAEEINSLRQLTLPDISDVFDRINALSQQVADLPLAGDSIITMRTTSEDEQQTSEGESEDDNESRWSVIGRSLLKDFGDAVQIEKKATSADPVISPELRELARQKVLLLLETAQLAMLRQNQSLYDDRLQVAANWVKKRFDVSDAGVSGWLQSLATLEDISVSVSPPDISKSLGILRSRMMPEIRR